MIYFLGVNYMDLSIFDEAPNTLDELKEYLVKQADFFGGIDTVQLTLTLRESSTYDKGLTKLAYNQLLQEGRIRKLRFVDGSYRVIVPYRVY